MCDPVVGMAVLGGLQAASGYAAYQEGKFNAEQQEAAFKRNREEAIRSGMQEARALALQREQVRGQAFDKKLEARLESLRAKGRAQASESGVIQNANVLEREITRQGLRNADSIARNLEARENQLDLERAGITSRINSRINSVARGVKPSATAALLTTGGNIAGTAANFGAFDADGPFSTPKTTKTSGSSSKRYNNTFDSTFT